MIKKYLDKEIVLYSNMIKIDFLSIIEKINTKEIENNIWQFSLNKTIKDTNYTKNKKIFYLEEGEAFWDSPLYKFLYNVDMEKYKLKYKLNNYAFPAILDYINFFELKIKKIKEWTICENINETDFNFDLSRDGTKYSYAVLVVLNDNFSGGEFQFKDRVGNEKINLSFGDILIYPSNENYKYKELLVTSGIKYTAIAYF
jgi:hypothetical protein